MALIRGLACSRRTEQGSLEVLVFATMGVKKCGGRLQGSWHRILSLSYLRDVLAKWVLLQSAVCPLLLLLALFHLLSKDDLFWFSTGVFSSLSKRFGRFFFQRFGRFPPSTSSHKFATWFTGGKMLQCDLYPSWFDERILVA